MTWFPTNIGEISPGISHDLDSDSIALHIIEDELGSTGPFVVDSTSYGHHSAILQMITIRKILVFLNKVWQADGDLKLVRVEIGSRRLCMLDCCHTTLMVQVGVQVLCFIAFQCWLCRCSALTGCSSSLLLLHSNVSSLIAIAK